MFSEIRDQCIDFKITYEFKEEKTMDKQMNILDLSGEFAKYISDELSKITYSAEMKDRIINYGSHLMNEVEKARNTEVLNR